MEVTKPRTSMGIWQMFAFASVLQSPWFFFLTYPGLGDPIVCSDLHRIVLPRVDVNPASVYVHDDEGLHQVPWSSCGHPEDVTRLMTLDSRSRDCRQSPKRRHVLDVHQIRFWVRDWGKEQSYCSVFVTGAKNSPTALCS